MNKYSVIYDFKEHFRNNLYRYVLIGVSIIIAIILGVYLAISGFSYTSLLTSADKNIFGYISGTAEYISIFSSRIWALLLCVLLIFCFNLIRETAFLNYIYLGYQMSLIVLSSSAIISVYGLSGVINVVLFVLPINIINIALLAYLAVISMERAYYMRQLKAGFFASFKEISYFKNFLIVLIMLIVFCFVYSFILPLVLKTVA